MKETERLFETGAAFQFVQPGIDLIDIQLRLMSRLKGVENIVVLADDLDAIVGHLTQLARQFRDTPMAGRSHLQHALPITFGFKCAVWLSALQRHRRRLEAVRAEVLVVQFGGAVGTLAALGDDGIAVLAALVKLGSKGPVFFRQTRIGQYGERFTMLKFRTMHVNANDAIHQNYVSEFIKSGASSHGSGSERVFKIVNDPRVTGIGRFLRKTSLDELPQVWSILVGDMSVVGPRPALFNQDDLVALRTAAGVHRLTPGLTGWAQINGRDELSIPDKVALDAEYLQRASLAFDLKIIAATVGAALTGRGVSG